jgi:hypothetical protein
VLHRRGPGAPGISGKDKEAGFRDVQVLSSREFYLKGEGSQALTKLLSITVKAYKMRKS